MSVTPPAPTPWMNQELPLTLGTNDWKCWISSATLTPDQDSEDFNPLCNAERRTIYGPVTWTLELTVYQDWTEDGLSEYLFDHMNETVPFVIGPGQVGGAAMAGSVMLVPGAFGGDAGSLLTADVTLPAFNVRKLHPGDTGYPTPATETASVSSSTSSTYDA